MAVRRYYCSWRGCKTLLDCAGYCDKHKELAQERDRIRQQKRQDMFAHARRTNLAHYRVLVAAFVGAARACTLTIFSRHGEMRPCFLMSKTYRCYARGATGSRQQVR